MTEEVEKKPKLKPLMKVFLGKTKANGQTMDDSVKFDENGEVVFENTTTQFAWLNFKLGHEVARKYQPGLTFIGKVTEDGIQIASAVRTHHHQYAAKKALDKCEQQHGGKFVAFSISSSVYVALREFYRGNPKVEFMGDEVHKLPFIIRENEGK